MIWLLANRAQISSLNSLHLLLEALTTSTKKKQKLDIISNQIQVANMNLLVYSD